MAGRRSSAQRHQERFRRGSRRWRSTVRTTLESFASQTHVLGYDTSQELVFIGIDLDEPHISDKLRSCLLTEEEEWSAGPKAWKSYEDPFATLIGN